VGGGAVFGLLAARWLDGRQISGGQRLAARARQCGSGRPRARGLTISEMRDWRRLEGARDASEPASLPASSRATSVWQAGSMGLACRLVGSAGGRKSDKMHERLPLWLRWRPRRRQRWLRQWRQTKGFVSALLRGDNLKNALQQGAPLCARERPKLSPAHFGFAPFIMLPWLAQDGSGRSRAQVGAAHDGMIARWMVGWLAGWLHSARLGSARSLTRAPLD